MNPTLPHDISKVLTDLWNWVFKIEVEENQSNWHIHGWNGNSLTYFHSPLNITFCVFIILFKNHHQHFELHVDHNEQERCKSQSHLMGKRPPWVLKIWHLGPHVALPCWCWLYLWEALVSLGPALYQFCRYSHASGSQVVCSKILCPVSSCASSFRDQVLHCKSAVCVSK